MAIQNTTYPFELNLETDPFSMRINSSLHPGLFKSFFVRDSILDYFPYMEFVINDDAGLFIEDNLFTEGLKWKFDWGFIDDERKDARLIHNFYWSEDQIPASYSQDMVIGDVIFPFLSDFSYQDYPKSKSWNKNISDIISDIMNTYDFPTQSKKINITKTSNSDYWYQSNESDAYLIDEIFSNYAYSPSYPKSPWYGWINLRGEFNFKPVHQLFDETPKFKFKFGDRDKSTEKFYFKSLDDDRILSFGIIFPGDPVNRENLNKKLYYLNSDGTYTGENITLQDKFYPISTKNVMNIRKSYLEKTRAISSFGLIDSPDQKNMYQGWQNSRFINSTSFPFRTRIQTNFHPELVAGDVIETEIISSIDEKDYIAEEFSGKWVIIESLHGLDQSYQPISSFILGKNSISIYKKHKFYSDFKW